MLIKQDALNSVNEVVLRNTGLTEEEFLFPNENPFIYGLDEAVECLLKYKDMSVKIVGDYDADGICGTGILYHALSRKGFRVTTRLPHRISEGYGLSEKIIDEIENGVVLTVDNGIASSKAIEKAKEKGLVVIIIDHHLAPISKETGERILPNADIIVNPNAEDFSEYKHYCGAGLAYRFAQKLLPDSDLSDLLVLASIATVADMVKLIGANRMLVKRGLEEINKGKGVYGLRQLLRRINLLENIQEDDYGFKIGPLFNASGRLIDDGAEKVLTLLKSEQDSNVEQLVEEIFRTNETRKERVKECMPIAKKLMKNKRPIVIYHPTFEEGIIGIIAGNLCEEYECPTIVFTKSKDGNLKGSGRSIPGFHLKDILDNIQSNILKYGGHAGAAGLTIQQGTLEKFQEAFTKACGDIPDISEDKYYDIKLKPNVLKYEISELKKYAPYGEGNPKPKFMIDFVVNNNYRRIGDGTHMLIKGKMLSLIGFGLSEKYESMNCPNEISCIGVPKEDWFNGNCYYKFEIQHIEERV